uniref:Uncharacterized protein n=1 Tax=Cacopsylla melanoneura TaxID=428564 RepID=A0A8D8LQY8_9HEMI
MTWISSMSELDKELVSVSLLSDACSRVLLIFFFVFDGPSSPELSDSSITSLSVSPSSLLLSLFSLSSSSSLLELSSSSDEDMSITCDSFLSLLFPSCSSISLIFFCIFSIFFPSVLNFSFEVFPCNAGLFSFSSTLSSLPD